MSNGEQTNIVIAKMLKKRQSMRLPIIGGALLASAFATYMVMGFGNQKRKAELKVDGPVYSGKTMSGNVEDASPSRDGNTLQKAIEGQTAAVEVDIVPLDVVLWLDGKQLGGAQKHTLSVAPGKHVLMFQQKERTVMQKLSLEAGESYRVQMRDKVTLTKLR